MRSNHFSRFAQTLSAFSVLLAFFICLPACGGGSSSSSPPSNQTAAGLWNGTASSATFGNFSLSGIVASNNQAFFVGSTEAQYSGNVTVSGTTFTATLTAYAPVGQVFPNGLPVTTVTLSGAVSSQSSLSGSYQGAGDSGTFNLNYNPNYANASSLSFISGSWGQNSGGTALFIGPTGQLQGTNISTGCSLSGQVGTIDAKYNAYSVNVSITSCFDPAANGSFGGLASLSANIAQNDTLTIGVSNPAVSEVGVFTRE